MPQRVTRRGFLAATSVATLAGCVGSANIRGETPTATPTATPEPTPTQLSGMDDTPLPLAPQSLPLPLPGAELNELAISGGPPKDGIPSIDDPSFEPAGDVGDRIAPGDIVFGLARDGEAKAYPQSILVWHEIVNDTIAGTPISATYCPLTGTVQGFYRGTTTFGVSGRLINNNLVMYDRATERWWPQILATSIPGPWSDLATGDSLREFRMVWTTWERWRDHHPETQVLTEDTGYAKNYNRDPYGQYNPIGGYYDSRSTLFKRLHPNDRYHPKRVVLGARTPAGAVAFVKETLREAKLMPGELGDTPVLAVYDPRLDTGFVYLNPNDDVFEYSESQVIGTDGEYRPGELPLESIVSFDAMWFAWSGYYPNTAVFD